MPALTEDVEGMEREGIKIELQAAAKRLISENGKLSAIECIRMKLGEADASGRPGPLPIEGSEFFIPVDSLIAAIGQIPETKCVRDFGLSIGKSGVIQVSPETAATNIEGVFAGGDGAGARAFVADDIASGKLGALAIF